jgi:tetratricopeptide (TPR) repeat protein
MLKMLVPYPPLEAYRRDVERLGDRPAFGPRDARWVDMALLLQRFVDAPADERHELAPEIARLLAPGVELTFWQAGLEVANEIEEAGALHLCYTWLFSLERIVPETRVMDTGRIRANRARIARKLGAVDLALELYGQVEQLGEQRAEPELTARAWIGYAVAAFERGNFPEARRWYRAAALVADDTGCAEQASLAHQGLLISFAVAGEFNDAIVEGWHAYVSAHGNAARQAEILSNVSQALYDMGQHAAALRGFAAAIAHTAHVRVLLPALGGVAMAAAALDRPSVVRAAATRAEALMSSGWHHPVALTLLDLADAYDRLGDPHTANGYRSRGLSIAEFHGLHQLAHRAREGKPVERRHAAPVELDPAAGQVVGSIELLNAPSDLCAIV